MIRSTIIVLLVLAVVATAVWFLVSPRAAVDLLIFAALCSPIYVAIWVFAREVPEGQRGFLARPRKSRPRPPAPIETVSCPECGCDLTNVVSPVCPECGRVTAQP